MASKHASIVTNVLNLKFVYWYHTYPKLFFCWRSGNVLGILTFSEKWWVMWDSPRKRWTRIATKTSAALHTLPNCRCCGSCLLATTTYPKPSWLILSFFLRRLTHRLISFVYSYDYTLVVTPMLTQLSPR